MSRLTNRVYYYLVFIYMIEVSDTLYRYFNTEETKILIDVTCLSCVNKTNLKSERHDRRKNYYSKKRISFFKPVT